MATTRYPTEAELLEMDAALGASFVPILDRPDQAMFRWSQSQGSLPGEFGQASRWFRARYQELYPSTDFSSPAFDAMCVSALGVPYRFDPPIIFGVVGVDPLEFVRIAKVERDRLDRASPALVWELRYQAADAIDLFMGRLLQIPGLSLPAAMHAVGYAHLQSTARQLLAGANDASIAHAVATASETVMKSVLIALGKTEADVSQLGHRLPAQADAIVALAPSHEDAAFQDVARSVPQLVGARYGKASPKNLAEALDLYRRGLFLCASATRRTMLSAATPSPSTWETAPNRQW